ncbi:ABC transporter permease [Streptomyces sp. Agncl-13]|uniref:ABC transporter permease n=1 Tax=Streptomyces sp. Agncl-13 TaxID=3400628 RepID=UPI003A8BBD19
MTADTVTSPTAVPSPVRPMYRVTGRRVIRSEWSKFWSLRSSWITLGMAVLFLVAIGGVAAAVYSPSGPLGGKDAASGAALTLALAGTNLAALAVGALGVLLSAGEYSTGMVRSTFAAVPGRLPVLWAKCAVYGPIAFVTSTVGALVSFGLGSAALHGEKIALSLGDPGVFRCLLGAGVYLGLVGVYGVTVGLLVRNNAGGIAILAGVVLVLPGLTGLLPSSLGDTVSRYLPSNAGQSVMTLHEASDSLVGPGAGLTALLVWAVLLLAGAAYRLRRSDV